MNGDILNPLIRVKVKGEDVEVRELTWRDHIRAVREMTATIMEMLGDDPKANVAAINAESIINAIAKQESLAAWVMAKSTGKDAAWVDSLSGSDALAILSAVVDLNLTEELVSRGKALAGRMSGVFGLSKVSLARSTP